MGMAIENGDTIIVLDFDFHGHLYTYGGQNLLKQLTSSDSIPDSASRQYTGTEGFNYAWPSSEKDPMWKKKILQSTQSYPVFQLRYETMSHSSKHQYSMLAVGQVAQGPSSRVILHKICEEICIQQSTNDAYRT